jgi:hypothetical protein
MDGILCTPTITTAALFVALIFLDLFRYDFHLLPGHGFFGLVSVFLMTILCQHGYGMAAWGLLMFPLVILILGWGFQASQPMSTNPELAAQYPAPPIRNRLHSKCCKHRVT